MAKPSKYPRWATGGSAEITEPAEGKKDVGWEGLEKPAHQFYNWLSNIVYSWLYFFYEEMLSPIITDAGVLKTDTVDSPQIVADAVGSSEIAPGAVTGTELNASIAGQGLNGGGGSDLDIVADEIISSVTPDLENDGTNHIRLSTLAAGDGLKGGSGSPLAVEPADFAGAGLEDDGSDNLRIAAAAAGDGLKGGAGAALAIEPADFAGDGLEDDGSDNLRIAAAAAGDGLEGGGGSALAVDLAANKGLEIVSGELAAKVNDLGGLGVDAAGLHADVDDVGIGVDGNGDLYHKRNYFEVSGNSGGIAGQSIPLSSSVERQNISVGVSATQKLYLIGARYYLSDSNLRVEVVPAGGTTWTSVDEKDDEAFAGFLLYDGTVSGATTLKLSIRIKNTDGGSAHDAEPEDGWWIVFEIREAP